MSSGAHVVPFARYCLDTAGAVTDIAARVGAVASSFRGHDVQAANAGLASLAPDLHLLVRMLQTLSRLPDAERDVLLAEGVCPGEQMERLGGWVSSLISAQEAGDWLTVSDVLEYDLAPALRAWNRALQSCGRAAVS
jgi:hypothetical protein